MTRRGTQKGKSTGPDHPKHAPRKTRQTRSKSKRGQGGSQTRPQGLSQHRKSRKAPPAGNDSTNATMTKTTNSVDGGCLVCGIDDNYDELLLCEKCDGEYHIYCLSPPLSAVPKESWFCDKCMERRSRSAHEIPITKTQAPVTISTANEQHSDGSGSQAQMHGKDDKRSQPAPGYLDDDAFTMLTSFLVNSRPEDELDEEDVCLQMEKINRSTRQQMDAKFHVAISDSDSESSLFDTMRIGEESIILGREFFQQTVSRIQRDQSVSLDKRTISWLKRATGVHRGTGSGASTFGRGISPQCYTRGRARKARLHHEDEGLEILLGAVADLETELELFRLAMSKGAIRQKRTAGVDQASSDHFFPNQHSNILQQLDRESRGQIPQVAPPSEAEFYSSSYVVPEFLKKQGVVIKPPQYQLLRQSALVYEETGSMSGYGTSKECTSLLNCLRGRGRLWIAREFFCSDIDRPWFSENLFVTKLEQMGIKAPPLLARSQWKSLRKLINRGRPRRFSRAFLDRQLQELHSYRDKSRSQPCAAVDQETAMRTISPGTQVAAVSRQHSIILSGRVISYDQYTARYVVQFDSSEFGQEFCPDFEVSSQPSVRDETPFPHSSSLHGTPPTSTKKVAQLLPPQAHSDLEYAAEYEAVVTLLMSLEFARDRKKELLDTMRSLITKRRSEPDEFSKNRELQNQHATNLENLSHINGCIDSLLGTLRDFHGYAYLKPEERYAANLARGATKVPQSHGDDVEPRCRALLDRSKSFGVRLSDAVVAGSIENNGDNMDQFAPRRNKEYMREITGMLTAAAFGSRVCDLSSKAELADLEIAFDAAASNSRCDKNLCCQGPQYNHLYGEYQSAAKELSDAISLYKTELALAR